MSTLQVDVVNHQVDDNKPPDWRLDLTNVAGNLVASLDSHEATQVGAQLLAKALLAQRRQLDGVRGS